MPDEHIDRAAKAAYEKMVTLTSTEVRGFLIAWEAQPEKLREDWRAAIEAAIEAWDYAGATLLSDFPSCPPTVEIIHNPDGTITAKRIPLPIRPLSEGYGSQPRRRDA